MLTYGKHVSKMALFCACFAFPALAQDKTFTLAAPDTLVESGILKFILPRFSLKTQTRITVVDPGSEADASFGKDGMVAFQGLDQVWRFDPGDDPVGRRAER